MHHRHLPRGTRKRRAFSHGLDSSLPHSILGTLGQGVSQVVRVAAARRGEAKLAPWAVAAGAPAAHALRLSAAAHAAQALLPPQREQQPRPLPQLVLQVTAAAAADVGPLLQSCQPLPSRNSGLGKALEENPSRKILSCSVSRQTGNRQSTSVYC